MVKQLDLISLLLREEERMEDDHGDDADELHVFREGCPTPDDEGMRVCPWVSCRHHLALEVRTRPGGRTYIHEHAFLMADGELQLNTGAPMCSMDVAGYGGVSLELLGDILGGLTRERARQVIAAGVYSIRSAWEETTGEAVNMSADIPRGEDQLHRGSRLPPRWMAAARKHGVRVREKKKAAIKAKG